MKKRIARLASTLLLVVALGGAAASAAQAHEWTIGGETLTKLGLTSEPLSVKSSSTFYFKTSLLSQELKWRCTPTFSEAKISQGGKGTIQIGFSGCTFETGGIQPPCELTPLVNPTLRTELVEVGGVLYLKFLPSEKLGERPEEALFGWLFAGTDCVAHGNWYFQGSFAAKINPVKSATVHTFEVSPESTSAAGAALRFGPNKATLSGTYSSALNGKNAGKTWAGE